MKKTFVFLAAVIILSAIPAFAATSLPPVAATVNGEKITKEELIKTTVDWDAPMVLERLIMYKIVDQEAKKAGIVVTTKDVDAKFAEAKKSMPPGQDFKDVLKRNGMTVNSAYAYMKMNIQVEGIVRKSIKVTPEDLAAFNRASHILIRVPSSADAAEKDKADAEAKAKIEKIAAEIKAGMSFEEAAKTYSEDPMNKDKGGDLGFFAKGQMVPEFEKAIESLKPGQVSDPVKTTYGYHIIKYVSSGKDAKGADRKKLEDQISSRQTGEKANEFMMGARNRAKVVNFVEPEKKPAAVKAAPKPGTPVKPAVKKPVVPKSAAPKPGTQDMPPPPPSN